MKPLILSSLFTLTLYLAVVAFPGAQASAWAAAENKAILLVGNMDDETSMQSVAAVKKKLKDLKAAGTIRYKCIAYDFSMAVPRKYLEELGIGASAIPLIAIVEINPNDSPKKILWRSSAREPDKAVSALLNELGVKVSSTPAITRPEITAASYVRRGETCLDNSDYNGAITNYTMAIELDPSSSFAYLERGYAYRHINDYDSAISDDTKAISLKPDYADAYNNRGFAYYLKKDYDSAMQDYSKAISLEPDYAKAYINRGNVYFDKKDYDSAIREFSKAISLKPNEADHYDSRSRAYYNKKDYDRAWADVKQCRGLGGKVDPSFLENLQKASGRNE